MYHYKFSYYKISTYFVFGYLYIFCFFSIVIVAGSLFLMFYGLFKLISFSIIIPCIVVYYIYRRLSRSSTSYSNTPLGRFNNHSTQSPFPFNFNNPSTPFNTQIQKQMGQTLINTVLRGFSNMFGQSIQLQQELSQLIISSIQSRVSSNSRATDLLGNNIRYELTDAVSTEYQQVNDTVKLYNKYIIPVYGSRSSGHIHVECNKQLNTNELQHHTLHELDDIHYTQFTLILMNGEIIDLLQETNKYNKSDRKSKIVDAEYSEL